MEIELQTNEARLESEGCGWHRKKQKENEEARPGRNWEGQGRWFPELEMRKKRPKGNSHCLKGVGAGTNWS